MDRINSMPSTASNRISPAVKCLDRRIRDQAWWRRVLFFGLTVVTAGFATGLMFDIFLTAGELMPVKIACLCLFCLLFLWIGSSFWTAVAGFIIQLRGYDSASISSCIRKNAALKSRTALIMPIYNEDVQQVLAGINATWTSLKDQAEQHAFDFFILSDTNNPEVAKQECAAWCWLVDHHQAKGRIFYRRRMQNVDQKPGNIANFVRNWGGSYDYMVVLDADSVMSGEALVTLARLMDDNPRAGIIQTLPLPMGSTTLFGRVLQFAARLNSSMLARGAAFWHLSESNYWGHNAIIRTRAFADHCALPRLRGAPPFGGSVLSHDFVEAAFIRRAGYQVWLLPELSGSWEGIPSNVLDYVTRDRRWVQGNLQHLRILSMPGLHWLSRFHLLTGIMSYVSSALWFLLLLLSSVITCQFALQGHQFFEPHHYMLFPNWPRNCSGEVTILLGFTFVVLFFPKLFGLLITLKNRTLLNGFGGSVRLIASLLIEQLFSVLFAPTMMMFHTDFVMRTLLGKITNWRQQIRQGRRIGLLTALRVHGIHVLIASAWGTALYLIVPKYLLWLLPVLGGLMISVPLTMISSSDVVGGFLRKCGFLMTPEELRSPPELRSMHQVALMVDIVTDLSMMTPPSHPLRMEPSSIPTENIQDLAHTT